MLKNCIIDKEPVNLKYLKIYSVFLQVLSI